MWGRPRHEKELWVAAELGQGRAVQIWLGGREREREKMGTGRIGAVRREALGEERLTMESSMFGGEQK